MRTSLLAEWLFETKKNGSATAARRAPSPACTYALAIIAPFDFFIVLYIRQRRHNYVCFGAFATNCWVVCIYYCGVQKLLIVTAITISLVSVQEKRTFLSDGRLTNLGTRELISQITDTADEKCNGSAFPY